MRNRDGLARNGNTVGRIKLTHLDAAAQMDRLIVRHDGEEIDAGAVGLVFNARSSVAPRYRDPRPAARMERDRAVADRHERRLRQ